MCRTSEGALYAVLDRFRVGVGTHDALLVSLVASIDQAALSSSLGLLALFQCHLGCSILAGAGLIDVILHPASVDHSDPWRPPTMI